MKSFKDLRAATFPPQHYLISHGLLPVRGLTVVAGQPKSLKSFTVNEIMFALVTGTNVFGCKDMFMVPEPKKVLYLEQEIGDEDCKGRMLPGWESMTPTEQELVDENLYIESQNYDLLIDNLKGCEEIGKLVEEIKPDVLVMDPLKDFTLGSDENSTRDMGLVVNNLKKLKTDHGVAIILVHHTAKPPQNGNQRNVFHDLRGSSVLYGAGDAFSVQRILNKKEGRVRIDFDVRRHKPVDSIVVERDPVTLRMRYISSIEDDDVPEQPKTKMNTNGNTSIGTLIK